jgi:adenylate cyclase
MLKERADEQISLSTVYGFPLWHAWGTFFSGCVLVGEERENQGIAQIREGIAAFRAQGSQLYRPYCLASLAEGYGKAGKMQDGLSAIGDGLTAVAATDDRCCEPELYRLEAELTLQSAGGGHTAAIERDAGACFEKALKIARHQQAKSPELRAATSLARLWQQQGKTAEAHQLLSEIYNWFTEGFNTKDLQDAKALLEELG